ncbi:MAG: hypothetical protein ACOH19_16525 [Rhodoglobus sp.]
MTTLATFPRQLDARTTRRARPRGIDLLIMRLSLTTLRWARRRADRRTLTREQHILGAEQMKALAQREREMALFVTRLF